MRYGRPLRHSPCRLEWRAIWRHLAHNSVCQNQRQASRHHKSRPKIKITRYLGFPQTARFSISIVFPFTQSCFPSTCLLSEVFLLLGIWKVVRRFHYNSLQRLVVFFPRYKPKPLVIFRGQLRIPNRHFLG